MLTEKDYCDYETCVSLRELGYNAPQRLLIDYFGVYDEPQYDERIHLYDAQKWLREEKSIIVYPMSIGDLQHQKWYAKIEYMDFYSYPIHDTYEDALSEGLREAIKILKEE